MVTGQHVAGGPDRAGVRGVSGRGRVRRHVHGQHDVIGDRGDGDVCAGRGIDTGDRPAQRDGRLRVGRDAVQAAGAQHPPRDIITRKSLENAITVVLGMGGSTNAVLHLLAIAREAEVDLSIDDFGQAQPPHAVPDRPAAGRAVRDGRHGPRRRAAGPDEGAAGGGTAAPGRDDGHGQYAGREPGDVRREAGRPRHVPGIRRRAAPRVGS